LKGYLTGRGICPYVTVFVKKGAPVGKKAESKWRVLECVAEPSLN
jgi:hypothetical protein